MSYFHHWSSPYLQLREAHQTLILYPVHRRLTESSCFKLCSKAQRRCTRAGMEVWSGDVLLDDSAGKIQGRFTPHPSAGCTNGGKQMLVLNVPTQQASCGFLPAQGYASFRLSTLLAYHCTWLPGLHWAYGLPTKTRSSGSTTR